MKLSDMVAAYTKNIGNKAKLKKQIKLNNGITLKKGTVSVILIDKGNGKYHFEANNTATTVDVSEIEFV